MNTNEAEKVLRITGPGVPVRGSDIDTDQVIPARFLKEVTFDNMGRYAFYDARREADGSFNDHPFNRYEGARLLVVNQNFGCGSSREHAPQALMRWGIEGLIGESFADIFAGNCQALGIPTAIADQASIERIMARVEQRPRLVITLHVESETVRTGGDVFHVHVPPTQKETLLNGLWDTTALMKSYMDEVQATARRLPYLNGFTRPAT